MQRWAQSTVAAPAGPHARAKALAAAPSSRPLSSPPHPQPLAAAPQGCAEACVYVLDETLLRLANTHATEEERALCSPELSLIGAAAAKVSVKSIAGSALRANVGAATLVERARGDNRYHEPTDRLPGRAVPGALLYVSLSDARSTADGGGLRAVVRCARPWASVPGGAVFTPERQRALQRLAPLFSLALRACVAAETTARREEAARAALMASVGRSLGVPTVGLGPLMGTWAETCREAAGAERCCLFLHDAAARQLLTFLPGEAAAARIDVDDKRAALVAACARRNEVINVTDVSKEPRYDAEADTLAGLATLSALTLVGCPPLTHPLCSQPMQRHPSSAPPPPPILPPPLVSLVPPAAPSRSSRRHRAAFSVCANCSTRDPRHQQETRATPAHTSRTTTSPSSRRCCRWLPSRSSTARWSRVVLRSDAPRDLGRLGTFHFSRRTVRYSTKYHLRIVSEGDTRRTKVLALAPQTAHPHRVSETRADVSVTDTLGSSWDLSALAGDRHQVSG